MYGKPLDPKKTAFGIGYEDKYRHIQSGNIIEEYDYNKKTTNKGEYTMVIPRPFQIFLLDLEDPSNDDIRDVVHPDFDALWGNSCECVFEPWKQSWIDKYSKNKNLKALTNSHDARQWLISIGMKEDPTLAHAVGG